MAVPKERYHLKARTIKGHRYLYLRTTAPRRDLVGRPWDLCLGRADLVLARVRALVDGVGGRGGTRYRLVVDHRARTPSRSPRQGEGGGAHLPAPSLPQRRRRLRGGPGRQKPRSSKTSSPPGSPGRQPGKPPARRIVGPEGHPLLAGRAGGHPPPPRDAILDVLLRGEPASGDYRCALMGASPTELGHALHHLPRAAHRELALVRAEVRGRNGPGSGVPHDAPRRILGRAGAARFWGPPTRVNGNVANVTTTTTTTTASPVRERGSRPEARRTSSDVIHRSASVDSLPRPPRRAARSGRTATA